MISYPSCHTWCLRCPFLNKELIRFNNFFPKTHMRPSKIVECLKKSRLFSEIRSFFTKPKSLADQWRQGMPNGQIQSFQEGSTDFKPQLLKSFRTTLYPICNTDNFTAFIFFYYLAINQIRMGFFHWIFGPSFLTSSGEYLYFMVAFNERIVIATI